MAGQESPRPGAQAAAGPEFRYDLPPSERRDREVALVGEIERELPVEGLFTARIDARHPYSEVVRTVEQEHFHEVPSLMERYEPSFVFIAIVDTRPATRRIVHAFRVGIPEPGEREHGRTGLALLDDIIQSDQGVTLDDVVSYYDQRNFDLARAISVETNFSVGERIESPIPGIRISDFGYLSVFYLLQERSAPVIFAHQNLQALASLGKLGLEYEDIAGRPGLRTPSLDEEGNPYFDDEYTPLALPASEHNVALFTALSTVAVPELVFDQSGLADVIIHLPTEG